MYIYYIIFLFNFKKNIEKQNVYIYLVLIIINPREAIVSIMKVNDYKVVYLNKFNQSI